jgi:DNA modification methylase
MTDNIHPDLDLAIVYRRVDEMTPAARNPRTHTRKQIQQIADSIARFGFVTPILIDADGTIIAGHGRVAAAALLGLDRVPTVRLDHMTEPQRRAYALADNKLAENAGWDRELLALELQYLDDLDLDFDLSVTGFEIGEIDLLLDDPGPDPAVDQVPPVDASAPAVSRPGDLWRLGRHRLLCGDATDAEAYDQLLAGEPAQMVFIDPPYNLRIDGHVCGSGAIKHREFAMAAGEMSEAEFTGFLQTVFGHLAAHSADGAIHFVCMDWRHLFEVLTAGRAVYSELKNVCIWNKSSAGMGSFYRSQHELVLVFKAGTAPHINTFELGQYGRHRSNVWDHPGVGPINGGRRDELALHPTVKPVQLVADAILDCSHRRGLVLDAFAGAGTTVIAAERTGRQAYAMELDPTYVDTTIRRWQQFTGDQAVHAETGRSFAEAEATAATPEAADAG